MSYTPSANIVALADAAVVGINAASAGTFNLAFTAARSYLPLTDLTKVAESPNVLFIPFSDSETHTGGNGKVYQGEYQIYCIIYARVGAAIPAMNSKVDALLLLRNQLRNWFKPLVFNANGMRPFQATVLDFEGDPTYWHDALLKDGLFVSEQVITFKVLP